MRFSALLQFCLVLLHQTKSLNAQQSAAFAYCPGRRETEENYLGFVKARSRIECSAYCLKRKRCKSANFTKVDKHCVFLTNGHYQHSGCAGLQEDVTRDFVYAVYPCHYNQPYNGISCECGLTFTGQFCEAAGWIVRLYTTDIAHGDTEDWVYISVYGKMDESMPVHLGIQEFSFDTPADDFERGGIDSMQKKGNLTIPTEVRIRHDGNNAWHLNKVVLENEATGTKYTFSFNAWLYFGTYNLNTVTEES